MLQVSRTWLDDAANDGRIHTVRVGGPDGPVRFVEQTSSSGSNAPVERGVPGGEQRAEGAAGQSGGLAPGDHAVAPQIASSVSLAGALAKLCSMWP